MVGVAVPDVDHDTNVVVPVEEDERLLAKYNEDRVTEFIRLRDDKCECPKGRRAIEV